jgi:predicted nucleotidyltransferase
VKQVIVFGSAARQTATRKSDLDLMIIMETEKRFFDRYEAFDQVFYLIKDKSIDLLIYTPEELERISSRPFIRTILKEGRILYEHGE